MQTLSIDRCSKCPFVYRVYLKNENSCMVDCMHPIWNGSHKKLNILGTSDRFQPESCPLKQYPVMVKTL